MTASPAHSWSSTTPPKNVKLLADLLAVKGYACQHGGLGQGGAGSDRSGSGPTSCCWT